MNEDSSILFICSANKDRSKTAEDYFSRLFPSIRFDSAGTSKKICQQLGTNYVTATQVNDAERIFVMETKHLDAITQKFGNSFYKKITVLHIKDLYSYDQKDLIDVLDEKVSIS